MMSTEEKEVWLQTYCASLRSGGGDISWAIRAANEAVKAFLTLFPEKEVGYRESGK